jgi:hypothetical protein
MATGVIKGQTLKEQIEKIKGPQNKKFDEFFKKSKVRE